MSTMEQRERYESLYTATTQHLLVRDFDSAGSCVLDLLSSRPEEAIEREVEKLTDEWEERLKRWTRSSEDAIKAYKLYAFVIGSKHGERLEAVNRSSSSTLNPTRTGNMNLKNVFDEVISAYCTESGPPGRRNGPADGTPDLHPSILQTILLSLLKLSTSYPYAYSDSLSAESREGHPLAIARGFVERWLAGLEEDCVKALSFPKKFLTRFKASNAMARSYDHNHRASNNNNNDPDGRNNTSSESISTSTSTSTSTESEEWTYYTLSLRLSGMNKSYRSLLKTYVLEILPRFGDWELSREMILQGLFPRAEEQEKLLKKLHSLQVQHEQLQRSMHGSTSDLGRSVSSLSSSMDASDGELDVPGLGPDPKSNSTLNSTSKRDTTAGSSRMARPPSPSAASVQTDRTVRAVDYMKGRGTRLVGRGSAPQETSGEGRNRADEGDRDEGERERSVGSDERKTDEESVVGSTRSLTAGSARFGHAAFETLRARIVRYLDTPIDQDPEHDPERGNQEEGPDRRPRARRSLSISRRTKELVKLPLHQRLSKNFGFRLIVRALSLVSIVLFLLSLVRRRQRRRALARGGVVRDVDVMQEVREAWGVVRDKVVAVFRMGTTISYV